MALKIGDYYTVKVQNEILYNNSGTADIKDTTTYPIGYLNKGDRHKIINVYYGTGNGSPNQTDGPGKTPLYGIMNTTEAYAIGWVRDEGASVTGARIYGLPSSITAESTGFRVTLEGSVGVSFTITAKIGTTTIYTANGTMGYATAYWDLSFDATARSKMVSALGSSSSATMTVTVVSKYNGSTIRSSEASTTVTAPPRAVAKAPVWNRNPSITFTNATNNIPYQNQTTINVSFSTSDLTYDSGARYNTSYIKIGTNIKYASTSHSALATSAGDIVITVSVGDTNNKWTTYTTTVTVEDAPPIAINRFVATRKSDENASIVASGTFSPSTETPSGKKLVYSIDRRIRGTTSWSSLLKDQNPSTSGSSWAISIPNATGFAGESSYDIRLTIRGNASTATGITVIGTESVPFSLGEHGIGAGVIFNNLDTANIQVGSGGINSIGPILVNGSEMGGGPSNAAGTVVSLSGGRKLMYGVQEFSASTAATRISFPENFSETPVVTITAIRAEDKRDTVAPRSSIFSADPSGFLPHVGRPSSNSNYPYKYAVMWMAIGV